MRPRRESIATIDSQSQIAAPSYAQPAGHAFNLDPHYDRIYFHADSVSAKEFGEARWLAGQLDSLPDDSQISFAAGAEGGKS